MLALELPKEDTKEFMNKLLKTDCFDTFETRNIDLLLNNMISIDGTNRKDQEASFASWSDLRSLVFEIIKLQGRPTSLKIVFSKAEPESVHHNAGALFLNIFYDGDVVNVTTAAGQKNFVMNKDVDNAWNVLVRDFFKNAKITLTDRE